MALVSIGVAPTQNIHRHDFSRSRTVKIAVIVRADIIELYCFTC
jgi:hypothetical protein